jgi:UDP-N-acetylmuramate dehydrogenase
MTGASSDHPSKQRLDAALRALKSEVSGRVTGDESVANLVSFRVGGPAAIVVEPQDSQDLARVGQVLAGHNLPALVVGRGTNLLVADSGFAGVIVRLGKGFDWIRSEGSTIEAGGATPLPQVANRAARLSLEGLEFAIAIPAAVGGAVRMNAGAHGASISDVVTSALVCDLATGKLATLAREDLRMKYRETAVGPRQVVCSALFLLRKGDGAEISARMKKYRDHRLQTQPADAPNAGSMFRNPEDDTAGRLIEAAGLKGCRVGEAEVSMKHANFFLAHPGATAQQIYDLMAEVQKRVLKHSGVLLIPEVRIVGRFDESSRLRIDK